MGGRSSKLKYNKRAVPHQEITVDEAVERIGMGRFQNLVLFATGTCFMADSVQVMLLSILTRKLQSEWEFDDAYISVINSCLFLGASVGTLFLGPLGDRIGRKPILISAASIISCFGLMTSFITRYEMLYPIIFAVGFGIGGLTVPFDIMAEFLPMEPRGYYLLFIKYYWTAGSMLVPILAYVTLELFYSWRLFAAVCVIPVLLSLVFGVLFVPESPRWLVQRGKKEKALKILRKAAERNGKDPYEVFPIGMVLADEEQEHADFKELFSVSRNEYYCHSLGIKNVIADATVYYLQSITYTATFHIFIANVEKDSNEIRITMDAILLLLLWSNHDCSQNL